MAVIKEIELKKDELTFGRKPNNDIVIDNPAVSGFHGKILKEGDSYYVEDLNSTNGTFLNGQRVKKTALKNKDQVGIARHVIEFSTDSAPVKVADPSAPAGPAGPAPTTERAAEEITPEKSNQLEILRQSLGLPAKALITPTPANIPPPPPAPAASPSAPIILRPGNQAGGTTTPRPGTSSDDFFAQNTPIATPVPDQNPAMVRIVAGAVNGQSEIKIKDMITYIGTSDKAAIKIKGLMAPSLAAAISKRPEGYFLKAVKAGYPKVNSNSVQEQILLENGALIEVGGTNMVFYLPNSKKDSE